MRLFLDHDYETVRLCGSFSVSVITKIESFIIFVKEKNLAIISSKNWIS